MDDFVKLTDIPSIMNTINKNNAYLKFIDMLNISSDIKEQIKLLTVEADYSSIQYIENPSELLQLKAVNQHGANIQYITNPSEQVQMVAIKRNASIIKFIKNPSEKVQLEVVKIDGYAIQYIKNPSEQVQLEAVKQNGYAIKHIENPSEQVQLEAIKQDVFVIQQITTPSITVCNYVYDNHPKYQVYLPIDFIKSKINKHTIDISNLTDDQIKVITKLITIMKVQNSNLGKSKSQTS